MKLKTPTRLTRRKRQSRIVRLSSHATKLSDNWWVVTRRRVLRSSLEATKTDAADIAQPVQTTHAKARDIYGVSSTWLAYLAM